MVITCMMLAREPLISTWQISEMKPGASIENDPENPVRNLESNLFVGHGKMEASIWSLTSRDRSARLCRRG